jgi:hypothetical protein
VFSFIGPKSPPKWADHVFDPNYRHAKWAEVWEFIDLPWIRSEAVVKEKGIDLEKDRVNLLEAVENLFLYLRDMDQRIDSSQHYQRPGIGAKCCQRNCVEGAVSSSAACLHTQICPLT